MKLRNFTLRSKRIFDSGRVSCTASRGTDTEMVQCTSNGSHAFPLRLSAHDAYAYFRRGPHRGFRGVCQRQCFQRARVPTRRTVHLHLHQSGLGALGNPLACMLGHGGDTRPALHQVRDEGDMAGQPVQADNEQHGTACATGVSRGVQWWPVLSLRPLAILLHLARNWPCSPTWCWAASHGASSPQPLTPCRVVGTRS
jgi:hypothetical protein